MSVARARLAPSAWLRLPRRTARLRLTSLYGGLFLLSGVALVAITYGLFERATKYKTPPLPKVPHSPAAIHDLKPPVPPGVPLPQLHMVQHQLAQAQHQFGVGFSAGPLAQGQQQLVRDQHQLARAVHQLAQAVHQLSRAGTVQAAQRAADSHQLLVDSAIALGIVAVLAVLAGWLVAGRMLRPIRTITRTARRISSTSLNERLALDGPDDELKELGDTLDELFGRLDAAFEGQRQFVANASHELRTPLTAERTLLQVALDDPDTTNAAWRSTAHQVLASSDQHARLLEALLTLAGSQRGLGGNESVDLAATVTATLTDLQPDIDGLGIHVNETTTPAPLEGDPVLIERLVANLLTNAVRHNIVDGHVEAVTGTREGKAFLSVSNTGPPIAPAEVERLFRPFQRLDPRRAHHKDGHGLGLSIVQAIANAHHAELNGRARPDGGLTIEVSFPRARSAATRFAVYGPPRVDAESSRLA
jgi:signal transduction histidine kinase